jgi:hypothetical protein
LVKAIEERFYMKAPSAIKLWLFVFFVCVNYTLLAQSETEKEKIRQLEIQRQADKQRAISMRLDSAVILLDKGEYESANVKFLSILKNVKSVPSDLTFYFGKNSYYLGKYKQSVDWLNKYIQLKGTTGQFSAEAVNIKKQSESKLLEVKEQEVKLAVQVLAHDYDIDCGVAGKVTCPVCNGTTVIVKKGYISDTYKTCGYCNLKGTLVCEDYNKLLRGELKPSVN